jgi:EAL domain-containing protein (putative c-di-GMP-specific phosphodiesterase class I)
VRTALDDFGTGYSSLAYLQRLPIGTLKIDRSFVSRSGSRRPARPATPCRSSTRSPRWGAKLGKTVVAEGVETPAQARYLQRIGVDRAQGYLFASRWRSPRPTVLERQRVGAAARRAALGPARGRPGRRRRTRELLLD